MRIMDYPKTESIVKGSTFLNVDSAASGTKAIESDDLRKAFINFTTKEEYYEFLDNIGIGVSYRRTIFRGKNLGSVLTDEQKESITSGFKGFFIGDYWNAGNIKYRIADINYWMNSGDIPLYTNHLVIVPDTGLGETQKMNDTDTTQGGYIGSKIITSNVFTEIREAFLEPIFGENILQHREILVNNVKNGRPGGGIWCDSRLELMNEPMVYGSYILTPGSDGSVIPYRYTIDKTQLALFNLYPSLISIRTSYWLRDVVSESFFAMMGKAGDADATVASSSLAVRPVFGIVA